MNPYFFTILYFVTLGIVVPLTFMVMIAELGVYSWILLALSILCVFMFADRIHRKRGVNR